MKLLIINGPNLNLLGERNPEIYGTDDFDSYLEILRQSFPNIMIHYFQSNHEGALIDTIQEARHSYEGIIINAGAYTHTSLAIADAIEAIDVPVVEVHISNIYARETFRHHSYLSAQCEGVIAGLGIRGYELAIQYFI